MPAVRFQDVDLTVASVRLDRRANDPDLWHVRFAAAEGRPAARAAYAQFAPGQTATLTLAPGQPAVTLTILDAAQGGRAAPAFRATRSPVVAASQPAPQVFQGDLLTYLDQKDNRAWLRVEPEAKARCEGVQIHAVFDLRRPQPGAYSAVEFLTWAVERLRAELGIDLALGVDPKGKYALLDPAADAPQAAWWDDEAVTDGRHHGGRRGLALLAGAQVRRQRQVVPADEAPWDRWTATFPYRLPADKGEWVCRRFSATWGARVRVAGDRPAVTFVQEAATPARDQRPTPSAWQAAADLVERVDDESETGGPFYRVELLRPGAAAKLVRAGSACRLVCGHAPPHAGRNGTDCGLFLPPGPKARLRIATPSVFVRPVIVNEFRRQTAEPTDPGLYLGRSAGGRGLTVEARELVVRAPDCRVRGKSRFTRT